MFVWLGACRWNALYRRSSLRGCGVAFRPVRQRCPGYFSASWSSPRERHRNVGRYRMFTKTLCGLGPQQRLTQHMTPTESVATRRCACLYLAATVRGRARAPQGCVCLVSCWCSFGNERSSAAFDCCISQSWAPRHLLFGPTLGRGTRRYWPSPFSARALRLSRR